MSFGAFGNQQLVKLARVPGPANSFPNPGWQGPLRGGDGETFGTAATIPCLKSRYEFRCIRRALLLRCGTRRKQTRERGRGEPQPRAKDPCFRKGQLRRRVFHSNRTLLSRAGGWEGGYGRRNRGWGEHRGTARRCYVCFDGGIAFGGRGTGRFRTGRATGCGCLPAGLRAYQQAFCHWGNRRSRRFLSACQAIVCSTSNWG
jgi:hypothetical protein